MRIRNDGRELLLALAATSLKVKFVGFHVDALAVEANALSLQAEALFKGGISAELDFTARA